MYASSEVEAIEWLQTLNWQVITSCDVQNYTARALTLLNAAILCLHFIVTLIRLLPLCSG